jgi:hypothetical protein
LQILNRRNIQDEKINQKSEYFEHGNQVCADVYPNLLTDNSVALIQIHNTVGKAGQLEPHKVFKRCCREEGAKSKALQDRPVVGSSAGPQTGLRMEL